MTKSLPTHGKDENHNVKFEDVNSSDEGNEPKKLLSSKLSVNMCSEITSELNVKSYYQWLATCTSTLTTNHSSKLC